MTNRPIIFRGQRKSDDIWVYGYLTRCGDEYFITSDEHSITLNDKLYAVKDKLYAVKPKTIGQFVGLTDINGVEIFENDIIVKHIDRKRKKQVVGLVFYSDYRCGFYIRTFGDDFEEFCAEAEYEVIGNATNNLPAYLITPPKRD